MKTARLIRADGTESPIAPANGATFTFKELYPVLGCDCIEMIHLSNGDLMLMDESGKYAEKAQNDIATLIADNIGGSDCIVGDVVVCPSEMLA